MKNSVRRGLFHPDDIKTIGLVASVGPGPLSAPLPSLTRKPSRASISPLGSFGPASGSQHIRSGSLASAPGSGSGSFGRVEAKKAQNQAEFGKYTEDEEEDYEDVFGKPNATCELSFSCMAFWTSADDDGFESYGTADADPSVEHSTVGQNLGMSFYNQ